MEQRLEEGADMAEQAVAAVRQDLPAVGAFIKESFSKAFSSTNLFLLLAVPSFITSLIGAYLIINEEVSWQVATTLSMAAFFVGVVSFVATFVAIKYYLMEGNISLMAEAKDVFRNLLSYIWLAILSGAVIMGGYFLLIVPGIILGGLLTFAMQVRMDESVGGMKALVRSAELVTGRWLAVVGRMLALTLCIIVLQIAFEFIFGGDFVSAILTPFLSAAFTMVLFYGLNTLYQSLKSTAVVDEKKRTSRTRVYTILAILMPIFFIALFGLVVYFLPAEWLTTMVSILEASNY